MEDEIIDTGADGGSNDGFDIDSGVEEIGESLFGSKENGDDDNGEGNDGLDFLGKEDAEEPKPAAPAAAATTPAPGAQAPATAAAPKTWRPEAAAEWEKIPPAVQAEIHKREEDIFKGLESYKQDATVGRGFVGVIQPYAEVLRAANVDPVQLTSNLLGVHYTLSMGKQADKETLLRSIAKDYGIDLSPQQQADPEDAPYVFPEVASLREENKALQSRLDRLEGTQRQAEQRQIGEIQSKLAQEIDAFAADPKHLYFDEVASDIVAQLKAGAKDLADAYEKAVFANPVTRAKELDRITAEKQAKAQADAQARVKAARQGTSANVRARTKSGSATTSSGGIGAMEDTMKEALARIRARDNG